MRMTPLTWRQRGYLALVVALAAAGVMGLAFVGSIVCGGPAAATREPVKIDSDLVREYRESFRPRSATIVTMDYFEWTMATAMIRTACVRGDTIAFLEQN